MEDSKFSVQDLVFGRQGLEFRVQGPRIRAFDSGFGCWGLDVNLWFKDVEFRATQGKTANFRPRLLQPSDLVVPLPSEKGPTCKVLVAFTLNMKGPGPDSGPGIAVWQND